VSTNCLGGCWYKTDIALDDKLNIEADVEELVMTLVHDPMTLEDLLAQSPKESFKALDDDRDWIEIKPVGREM
jgi:hypothetical protein